MNILSNRYLITAVAAVACFCFYMLQNDNGRLKKLIWILYSLILLIAVGVLLDTLWERLFSTEVFDFSAFYLWGKTAASGHNYCLPHDLNLVFNSLNMPPQDYSEFKDEIVNVGCMYPPQTALLFYPLGFLSYKVGLIAWTLFIFVFAFGCIFLLWKLFMSAFKLNGLVLIAILFFLSLNTRSTVSFSQTNFIVLFWLLMMKKFENKPQAGIFAALALFTKPYMITFLLMLLLLKNWKGILYFVITSTVITLITLALVGFQPFVTYFTDNPSARVPAWVFSETSNQSLHAFLIRKNIISAGHDHLFLLIISLIVITASVYFYVLIKRKKTDYIWASLLLLTLLIYPGTIFYYGVLLFFIVAQFFDEKNALFVKKPYVNTIFICVFMLFGGALFYLIWVLLIIVFIKSIIDIRQLKLRSVPLFSLL
ncbi:MAG TPA: glycosyltransferase family 87 protein [Chitinophagaceae bacterium]|nr:glycosyltransferase family 87 protein [Chitinophagaceae bacterium]